MLRSRKKYYVCLLSMIGLCGCNSTEGERFNEQKDYYNFTSNTSTLNVYGASRTIENNNDVFRCPVISGMATETNLTVFQAKAHGALPHLTLKTIPGIRSDAQGGIGISIKDLPAGLLDIYEKCNSTSYERLMTSCPEDYKIVESCDDAKKSEDACRLIHKGTHRLVISAQINEDDNCLTEETDRSPYHTSISHLANACDAFSPINLLAAYRVMQPSDNCCQTSDFGTLDFCFKPCGCRTLSIAILPKDEWIEQTTDNSDTLKIGVFSNVEGNKKALENLLNSMTNKGIHVAISLGNLTKHGSKNEFIEMRDLIDAKFSIIDGTPQVTNACVQNENMICCEDGVRQFDNSICNAIIHKIAFHAGLGEAEYGGNGLEEFREQFGPSNMATTIGKVQLIMLDTADASFGNTQTEWLESVLTTSTHSTCNIPAPENEKWPTLAECRQILATNNNTKNPTCRECIKQEAYCIPPDAQRSDPSLGPENCVCVPATSQVCPHAQACETTDGTDAKCICTRDTDCGNGGTCIDGVCQPPIRLVFSYTPIFDEYGSRNNALSSKSEAAALMSVLTKSNVSAIFSGRVLDYGHFSMGGIPVYITGGGGAAMSSFASKKNHWLYIEIPRAYTRPNSDDISVQVIEFDID